MFAVLRFRKEVSREALVKSLSIRPKPSTPPDSLPSAAPNGGGRKSQQTLSSAKLSSLDPAVVAMVTDSNLPLALV